MGVAKERIMNNMDEFNCLHANYAGRQVDYTGAGLRLLINRYARGPLCLYNCLTGRPFQYQVTSHPDDVFTPYYSFVEGIDHALCVLGLSNSKHVHTHLLAKSQLTPKIYLQKMEDLLSVGPVLIGPFIANLFETAFAHTYRIEPNHCLVCVASCNNELLLLHPDGLPYTKSIEQLLNFHRVTPAKTTLLMSLHDTIAVRPIQELMELSLFSGAKVVQSVREAHGPSAFLACVMDVVSPKLKVKTELSLRLGLSDMSINLQMILDLVRHLMQYQKTTLIIDSAVRKLCQPLIEVLKACATLYTAPIKTWREDGEGLSRLSEQWALYENAMCAIISTSQKIDG